MANYSLVANSTFQPFTYQELAAPIDRQDAYFEKLNEEYDKLSSQADILEAMGANDRDKNSGTYSRYKAYSDKLRSEADNLYRFGLNSESRQRLSDLRRMYNTEIVPIQNAWNKREQESADQMKATLQNPSLMFTRDARNSSLDDYIKNPTGGYGVINGANITAQMAAMAKNLATQIRSGNRQNIDDYTYNYIEKYGLDENLIRNWQDSPTLKRMFEQVMESNGVTPEALSGSANAQGILDKSTGYAEMGMWNAMGADKTHQLEDYGNRLYAQMQKELAVAQAKAAGKGEGEDGLPTITSDGVGMESSEHYHAKGLEQLGALKAGYDGLKASYFGRQIGQVNPMAIYEDYKKELTKHTKQVSKKQDVYNPYAPTPQRVNVATTVPDTEAAKKAVLDKYKKYGVTDILTEDQYNLLSDMGYSKDNNPGSGRARFSAIEKGFNNLVQQKNRYSVNMTKYDTVDEDIRGNLSDMSNYNKLSGRLWEIKEDGKQGSPIKDVKDLKLYSADNTKGNKVNGIYYDPQFKGKIVFRTSDGKRYTATPDVINNEVARMINYMERAGYSPKAIAIALYEALNTKNKVQSETDSKI